MLFLLGLDAELLSAVAFACEHKKAELSGFHFGVITVKAAEVSGELSSESVVYDSLC
jgi:hypothetical protein